MTPQFFGLLQTIFNIVGFGTLGISFLFESHSQNRKTALIVAMVLFVASVVAMALKYTVPA